MIYYQYQTILSLSSPSQRKLNSKMHSWSARKYFQRMLFFLACVTVTYIAANKCAGHYHAQIETISKLQSVNVKGKDCISDVWYDLAGLLDALIIPVSEAFITFIAPLSLSTQNMVSGRHLSHQRSRHVSRSLV